MPSGGDWKEMYLAAKTGDFQLVKYHIVMGVDPNYQHPEIMTTALIESIEHQHYEIAEFLLQNGADPTIEEMWGDRTPLSTAEATKNQKFIDLVNTFI